MGPKKGRLRSSPHIVGNGSGLKQPRGVRGRYMGAPFNHQLLLASAPSETCMSDKTKIFLNARRFTCCSANPKFAFDAHFFVLIQFILNTILITVIVVMFIVIRNIIIFINIFITVALLISKRSKFYGCVPRSAF